MSELTVDQRIALTRWFYEMRGEVEPPAIVELVEMAATGMERGEVVTLLPHGCVVFGTWDASTWDHLDPVWD